MLKNAMDDPVHWNDRLFILWNRRRDGELRPGRDTDGVIGRVSVNNIYLTAYAKYPGTVRPVDLEVGECIEDVQYHLSGERGFYDVYRVV